MQKKRFFDFITPIDHLHVANLTHTRSEWCIYSDYKPDSWINQILEHKLFTIQRNILKDCWKWMHIFTRMDFNIKKQKQKLLA